MCLAGKNVTGLKVEFQGKTVPGKWEWDLTGANAQPWDANETTPYTAKVKFTRIMTVLRQMKKKQWKYW